MAKGPKLGTGGLRNARKNLALADAQLRAEAAAQAGAEVPQAPASAPANLLVPNKRRRVRIHYSLTPSDGANLTKALATLSPKLDPFNVSEILEVIYRAFTTSTMPHHAGNIASQRFKVQSQRTELGALFGAGSDVSTATVREDVVGWLTRDVDPSPARAASMVLRWLANDYRWFAKSFFTDGRAGGWIKNTPDAWKFDAPPDRPKAAPPPPAPPEEPA